MARRAAHRARPPAGRREFASCRSIFAVAAAGVGASLVPRSVLEIFPQRDALSVRDMPARLARLRTSLIALRTRHLPVLEKLEACLREDAAATSAGVRCRKPR